MRYNSKRYQLNSLRLGLVHEDNIYGKPTVFLVMGSQSPNIKTNMEDYKKILDQSDSNMIVIPFDHNGTEPGDDYEIVAHYENILNVKTYVTEKIDASHIFFQDFGLPNSDYTKYYFNDRNMFVKREPHE